MAERARPQKQWKSGFCTRPLSVRRYAASLVSLLCLLFIGLPGYSDRLFLQGGTTLEGRLVEQNEEQVIFAVEGSGEMTLPKALVRRIEVDETAGGEEPTPTPSPTQRRRVLPSASPTATPLLMGAARVSEEEAEKPAALTEQEIIDTIGKGREVFGKTRDTVGIVEVRRPGGEWEEYGGETVLFEGDEVRTKNGRTKVDVRTDEHETEVRVNEESYFRVPKSEASSTIQLLKGKVWSRIRSLSASDQVKFQIRTPNAVAGVRGTLLYVQLKEDNSSRVAVFEGRVQVTGAEQTQEQQTVGQLRAVEVSPQEQFSALMEVNRDELREWEEWDEWARQTKADLAPFTAGVPGARNLVNAQVDQIAAEGQLYGQMAAEARRAQLLNRQAEQLDGLKEAVLAYTRDVGRLPAEDRGLVYLQNNLVSSPDWQGPYLPNDLFIPVKDLYGNDIVYRIQQSEVSGRIYAELISPGPNQRLDDGRGDDIRVIIVPPEQ
jgi:hypothetical protein